MRILLIGTLALAGCMSTARDTSPPPDEQDTCGMAQYADLVGEPERNHSFDLNEGQVRIIYPNSAITQDYRIDRLNVDVNIDGDIARLWCG